MPASLFPQISGAIVEATRQPGESAVDGLRFAPGPPRGQEGAGRVGPALGLPSAVDPESVR